MDNVRTAEQFRTSNAPTDAALVVHARAGEAWACEALYRRYASLVYGLACRILGGHVDADDLLQETFVSAFCSIDQLADPNAFRSWVCGTLVRKACKLLRRRRLFVRLGLRQKGPPVEFDKLVARVVPPDAAVELRSVYKVIADLDASERTVLVLRRIEGATLQEIAELTGLSLATVKRRLAKAESQLKAFAEASV